MTYFLLVVFALLFLIITWKKPLWAIYAVIALLPTYLIRFKLLSIPFTWLELMILILFAVSLIRKQLDWRMIYRNHYFWAILSIWLFAAISVVISLEPIKGLGIFKAYFIEPALFFWVIISQIKTRQQLENIFWALGLSALYLSLFSFWQRFSAFGVPTAFLNTNGTVDRVVGPFGYPNALGLYLGPIIILFIGWHLYCLCRKTPPSFTVKCYSALKIIIILCSFLTIVLAKSEGAIVAIVAVCLAWGLLYKRTRKFSIGLIILVLIIFILNAPLRNFVFTKLLLLDYSGYIRRLIWGETWTMLKDNWLWGAGLSGYQAKIVPYHLKTFEIFPYPHNIILNFWSELGLLGLISFIYLFFLYFRENCRNIVSKGITKIHELASERSSLLSLTLIFIMMEIIIHGLVDAPYFKNDLSVMFWIFIAVSYLNRRID